MRNVMKVFGIGLFAMASLLMACGPVEPTSTEDQAESGLVEPVSREAPATAVPLSGTCESVTCRPGAAGDAYCTQICGDYAKCFSATFEPCHGLACCIRL